MYRKSVLVVVLVALFGLTVTVYASDPLQPGCYVDAPAAVDEGATFTATVTCNDFATVFGFEYGTTLTGDASTLATSYTQGTFTTGASGGVIVGSNTLAQYAVSRQGVDIAVGDFTLGSYDITADIGLTANGSTTVAIQNFKLSTILGVPISGLLQVSPDASIIINNIDLSLLTGNIILTSDGSMSALSALAMTLDGDPHNQATVAGNSHTFTVPAGLQYTDLNVDVTSDMAGHLACSRTFTLLDGANDAATQIGTITLKAGDVVSVSGDTAINIQDATAIGAQFGSSSPTGEVDVNGDGTVDIFDLVHVGRNYDEIQGTCS